MLRCRTSSAGATVTDRASDRYAIIDVGGVRQLVEEGRWYTCTKSHVCQVALGSALQFDKVLALKRDNVFLTGSPYLANVVVEAELLDEWLGPTAEPSVDLQKQSPQHILSKFFVRRICEA